MRDEPTYPRSRLPLYLGGAAAVLLLAASGYIWSRKFAFEAEGLVYEGRSELSHIKVVAKGTLRYLYFVRDSGDAALESLVDLQRPERLILGYSRLMFASLLIKRDQPDALLVGLGGGGMVSFINHFFPQVRLDVVEIDPEVIRVAREYFKLSTGDETRIIPGDGFDFIQEGGRAYDAIYLDAFLNPSKQTDSSGVPRKMKQGEFYSVIKRRLKGDGLLVININSNAETQDDIALIRASFPQTYLFSDGRNGAVVAIASKNERRVTPEEMRERAALLDAEGRFGFSFAKVVDLLWKEQSRGL